MKVLIDECLPVALKAPLITHGFECDTVQDAGLTGKKNGELLTLAEAVWDVPLTGDSNIKFQQNVAGREIAILVMRAKSNRVADLLPLVPACAQALREIRSGQVVEVGD